MTSRRLALILIFIALPAAAQMKSTRTILDAPATPATTTPATGDAPTDPCAAFKATVLKGKAFPTKGSAANAACFWDQPGFQMLSAAQLVSSGGSVAAATEVMSDFFYGWRIAFSTAIASEPEEDDVDTDPNDGKTPEDLAEEEAATNLLQANGGNMALSFSLPVYAKKFGNADNGTGGFAAITFVRLAGTFDAFGGDAGGSATSTVDFEDLNANAEWALTTQTRLLTVANKFDIELYSNAAVIAGTKTFRADVGIDPKDSAAFLHGELGANVKIGTSMLIGASWHYYSADGIDDGARLTIGFSR